MTDFNLKHTLECGQSFRWQRFNGWYYGVVGGRLLKILQEDETLLVESSADEADAELETFLYHYLDLNRDLSTILRQVDIDDYMHVAIETFWGMRILNQELWECLASFILSQNNNVPRIKGIIRILATRFGESLTLDDQVDYSFPPPEVLARAGVDALFDCRMGYRAPYLWEAATSISAGKFDMDNLKDLPYAEAKQALMQFKGIGEKVADCICLFSLGHIEALPVDVWIKRIVEQIYLKRQATIREIQEFAQSYFGEYLGYAQQYLFHYARTIGFDTQER